MLLYSTEMIVLIMKSRVKTTIEKEIKYIKKDSKEK